MASTIQALPSEVVHLIAAGEVIDSFASVVRELIENSLDAGATRIVVSVYPQQWRVRVADNGCGMSLEDLQQAASAHSTSKIRLTKDLWKINSLGFRGEALHSLTTLADLEIISRGSNHPEGKIGSNGWRIVYGDKGEPLVLEAAAIAPGTVAVISNLFGNCHNRRQGLPSIAVQMKAVQAVIQQTALCHPHVTWQIWQNEREWFAIYPSGNIKETLSQFLRRVHPSDLQDLKVELDRVNSSLSLVIGLPDRCHRHRPDWVRIAVNGRMVKCSELEQTVLGAFHKTLPRDRYPVCFLHLSVSPNQINWNRNPAKTEIYLNQLDYWQEQIAQSIEKAFSINCSSIKESLQVTRVSKLIKAAEAKSGYNFNQRNSPENILEEIGNFNQTNNTQFKSQTLTQGQNSPLSISIPLKAVAQINKTYIVAEHPTGMWLIEQHIAHERVLYEQICEHWQLVQCEPPIILYQLSPEQIEQLQRISLEIEPFGEELWAIRQVPALLQQREDCAEAILELSKGGDLKTAQVAVACRSAIRNGTVLSVPQMQQLLDEWQRTRNPRTCPHGRPIYLSLEETSLARFFRRNWVIGKSHGI
ncbi:DNA mismatch repair enzyme (predicted ATPase) [Rivularia sp. PCC 7116]|uniref:DNA mismatch repair endonuclease MutL n=1 Tax=Rivularia sp. PCC 7116 TaxID=373994 RepID=UPI00029EF3C6|nr:DNA mismatch repair endonuclease MutL [Rivularia sp. PCC 7116]AFY55077.1 DNA mismatch repair enzyme (predicted ATPase) [Rivularia sp. PCC 7116]